MNRIFSRLPAFVAFAIVSSVTLASKPDDPAISQLKDYRQWTKVNSDPVKVNSETIKIDPAASVAVTPAALTQTAI